MPKACQSPWRGEEHPKLNESCHCDENEKNQDDDRGGRSHAPRIVCRHRPNPWLRGFKLVEAPVNRGPDYMKKGSVTVGRAGRLSVHTSDERALGMRETESPPSCMHRAIDHEE